MKKFDAPLFVTALAAAFVAMPARAAPPQVRASTRLHRCGDAVCLQVRGRRSDPATPVLVEGREVTVSGRRHWRVSLPLVTVERWARPFARSILVETAGATPLSEKAALPIGLLGQTTDLAFLSVSGRR